MCCIFLFFTCCIQRVSGCACRLRGGLSLGVAILFDSEHNNAAKIGVDSVCTKFALIVFFMYRSVPGFALILSCPFVHFLLCLSFIFLTLTALSPHLFVVFHRSRFPYS